MESVGQGGAGATSAGLRDVVELADSAVDAMQEGTVYFSTTTRTTTMMAVEILTPLCLEV